MVVLLVFWWLIAMAVVGFLAQAALGAVVTAIYWGCDCWVRCREARARREQAAVLRKAFGDDTR